MFTTGSSPCVLMSKVSGRRAGNHADRSFARYDSDSCSSSRIVPGCSRRSLNTRLTAGRPGSPWMGRPSTSSEVIIAPLCSAGAASHCRPAARQSAFVRENRACCAVVPWSSALRPAVASTPETSANAAR